MSKRDRVTLKAFFKQGALPTEQDYADLIDAMVNQIDDGFEKSSKDGFVVRTLAEADRTLISFYKERGSTYPSWQIAFGEEPGTLEIKRGEAFDTPAIEGEATTPPAFVLTRDGDVGIGESAPRHKLDVSGAIRASGRVGGNPFPVPGRQETSVPADGKWHDITGTLEGCHAFEIMAGAGGEVGAGRYALTRAIAMNAFDPGNQILNFLFRRRSIKKQSVVYSSFADRISFRWHTLDRRGTANRPYCLQMRTNSNYGEGYSVSYQISQLWFDPYMDQTRPPESAQGGGGSNA